MAYKKAACRMILAADNIHGLNSVVADAMRRLDPLPIQALARRCVDAGAHIIDVNPGHLSTRTEDRMAFLVDAIQGAVDIPLMLDSPSARILARGLTACESAPILNAVWLDEERLGTVLDLASQHQTRVVALLMDARSFTPPTVEEKLALAIELRDRMATAGIPADRIIFDPVLPNLSWDDALVRVAEAVKTVRLLSSGAIFQEPVTTMAGLSNLRSGLRRFHPFHVEETCLALLAGAGLDIALADVLQPDFGHVFRSVSQMV
ncbi:MAG: dihydropteroate synthase [Desulfomonile sp.]|nr:dihydropteroate synthase [Desulfomonile sp.]